VRWCGLLLVTACGGAALDAQGRVGATDFAATTTLATSDAHETVLVFTDVAATCDDLAAGGLKGAAADVLYAVLSDISGGQQYPASFATSYNVGDTSSPAKAWFMRWSDACDNLEQTPANTGTVQVTVNGGGHLAGNFTFGFSGNDLIYGHFDVLLCPPITAVEPPLCF
jgi:hypothetical protein